MVVCNAGRDRWGRRERLSPCKEGVLRPRQDMLRIEAPEPALVIRHRKVGYIHVARLQCARWTSNDKGEGWHRQQRQGRPRHQRALHWHVPRRPPNVPSSDTDSISGIRRRWRSMAGGDAATALIALRRSASTWRRSVIVYAGIKFNHIATSDIATSPHLLLLIHHRFY